MTTASPGTLWRHKKRGTVYEIITSTAQIQCSTDPNIEAMFGDEDWTIYRLADGAQVYIRMTEEFMDGRFERVPE